MTHKRSEFQRADPPADPRRWRNSARAGAVLIALASALLLAACGQGGQHGFSGFPPAPVTLSEVKAVTVPVRFEYVGQTAGSKEAEVRARVNGILERRTYLEGGVVTAGQTLFVIDPKPYAVQADQADAEVARAQSQLSQAHRNLERLKMLIGDNAISKREYDDAVSAEEEATAGLKLAQAKLAEAKLNLSYTTVTSPVTGFASRATKSEGSLVAPGQDSLLTTVSQVDPLYVDFSVSENDRLHVSRLLAEGKLVAPDAKKGGGFAVSLRLSDGMAKIFPIPGGAPIMVGAPPGAAAGADAAKGDVKREMKGEVKGGPKGEPNKAVPDKKIL